MPKVSNENKFSDNIKNKTEKISDNVSKAADEGGIILLVVHSYDKGDYADIRRSKNYSEDNPVYKVKGMANGKKYEKYVNINDINPKNASLVEMGILHTHLSLNGEIPDGLSRFHCSQEEGETMYDKRDYLSRIKWLTDCQFSSNNMIMYSILNTQYKAYLKYC